jgi:hypothetical protein
MILAIMQPYYFPYIGYFQLMAACDEFVIYDDVQYSKGGWANRNRILHDHKVAWLTLPVGNAPLGSSYREKTYLLGPAQRRSHLARIAAAYRKAPMFDAVYPLVESLMAFEDDRVAGFNAHLVSSLAGLLGLQCRLHLGSDFDNPSGERGQQRILQLCKRLGADTYLNAIGGTALYQEPDFTSAGISLRFLRPVARPYPQAAREFSPFLSILDVLMHNPLDQVRDMLGDGRVLTPAEALALPGPA